MSDFTTYLSNKLLDLWGKGQLPSAAIISSRSAGRGFKELESSEGEIMAFLKQALSPYTSISPENNSDIHFVRADDDSKTRVIKVEQIRSLQEVLHSKAGLTDYKFAFIMGAEGLNLNASNALLKILEDTPQNCFIFLVTSHPSQIIQTIHSRCMVIEAEESGVAYGAGGYSGFEGGFDGGFAPGFDGDFWTKIYDPSMKYQDKIKLIEKFASNDTKNDTKKDAKKDKSHVVGDAGNDAEVGGVGSSSGSGYGAQDLESKIEYLTSSMMQYYLASSSGLAEGGAWGSSVQKSIPSRNPDELKAVISMLQSVRDHNLDLRQVLMQII